jgi:Lectin C-type domain
VPKTIRASWIQARVYCQSYGMQLAQLESSEEHEAVKGFCKQHKDILTAWNFVDGGSPTKKTEMADKVDWYFDDGRKIPYNMEWYGLTPDNAGEKCLCLDWHFDKFTFNDIFCSNLFIDQSFICQDLTIF